MKAPSIEALGLSFFLATGCAATAPAIQTNRTDHVDPVTTSCPDGMSLVVNEGQSGCLKDPNTCSVTAPIDKLRADCASFGERAMVEINRRGVPVWKCKP